MAETTGAQTTVLVGDDEAHIVSILQRRFEAVGWRVVTASNGREAVEVARREVPDAIILDYQMPELSGVEAAREIGSDERTSKIPVMLLSGRSHRITPTMLEGTGVVEVQSKPFSAAEIVEAIAAIIGRDAESVSSAAAQTIETHAVGEAYDALSLVYRLCGTLSLATDIRSMCESALRGLSEATGIRALAIAMNDDPLLSGSLAGRVLGYATAGEQARLSLNEWLSLGERASGIVTDLPSQLGDEAVIVPIQSVSLRFGALAAYGGRAGWAEPRGDLSMYDLKVIESVSQLLGTALENAKLYRDQERHYLGTLTALGAALEAKDPYTRGHSERVAWLGSQLGRATGMPEPQIERIELAGHLHDIGKIGVPDAVLMKPARLTDDEFALIKRHPGIGFDMLRAIPSLEDVLPAVRNHHERWDGRGYPDGLEANNIDKFARILALADTFDAMSSNRAYRSGRDRSEVLAEIERNSGAQFDPGLVPAFVSLDFAGYDEIKAQHERGEFGNQRAA